MEKVYILGAGSSSAAGAPLIRDFKKRAEEVCKERDGSVNQQIADTIDSWNKTAPASDVEEFYILADLLGRLNADGPSQRLAEGVRYLIAKTLELSMGKGISEIHRRFVHKVWDLGHVTDFAIITLNWDIAVDNASYTHDQFYLDYGYEKARSLDSDTVTRHRRPFRVLKLHGSLNWWACQNEECQILWYRRGEKDVSRHWEQADATPCGECGSNLVPLMVPPTGQKFEYSQAALSPMRAIWKEAREGLRSCQEVAILGYSFPPTDVQFRMFLLEALARNNTLRNILVVSSPKIGSRRQRFEDSYDEAFAQSPHRQRLHFLYKNFEDWVMSGMPFEV